MYHSYFGKLGQLRFPKPEDYYRFLGYLAHADIKVVYEYNEDTGSWGMGKCWSYLLLYKSRPS
jgi:hypothetical protein